MIGIPRMMLKLCTRKRASRKSDELKWNQSVSILEIVISKEICTLCRGPSDFWLALVACVWLFLFVQKAQRPLTVLDYVGTDALVPRPAEQDSPTHFAPPLQGPYRGSRRGTREIPSTMTNMVLVVYILLWMGAEMTSGTAFLRVDDSQPESIQSPAKVQFGNKPPDLSRILEDPGTVSTKPSLAPSSRPLSSSDTGGPCPFQFSILLPLISASAIMWAMRRNNRICCNEDTVVDDSIPSEIILSHRTETKQPDPKPDIELQSVVGTHRTRTSIGNDPVTGTSMLNQSDWTDEMSQQKDSSFSWMEETSAVDYRYMND